MAENTVSAEIYEIACAAAGADESEKKLLERLCAQAEERLKAALRAGVFPCRTAREPTSARRRGWLLPRWTARASGERSSPPCARAS